MDRTETADLIVRQQDLEDNSQLALFDYSTLDTETRVVVQQRTEEIHTLMRRSAQDIVDIGRKLIDVKGRLQHGQFQSWLRTEFAWSYDLAVRFIRVAQRFESVNFTDLEFAPSALYALAAPSTPEPARFEALERAEQGERITHATAQDIVREHRDPPPRQSDYQDEYYDEDETRFVCDDCGEIFDTEVWHCLECDHHWLMVDDVCKNCVSAGRVDRDGVSTTMTSPEYEPATGKMAVHYSSDSPEWYTPPVIIERVVKTLGRIDLDPCSNSEGTPQVPADNHLTAEDDGLAHPWRGTVYMNPPYGGQIKHWIEKLSSEYESGQLKAAVALVPARTDTAWFRRIPTEYVCFVNGRLTFSQHESAAPFPSAAIYLGDDPESFIDAFSDIGIVYQRLAVS